EVVHLEPRGPPLITRLEPGDPPTHLTEEQLLRVARERRPGRVEWEAGVGALVVVHRVPLGRRDRRRRSPHATHVHGTGELIAAPQEAVPKVERTHVRAAAERGVCQRVEAAVHRCGHDADAAHTWVRSTFGTASWGAAISSPVPW